MTFILSQQSSGVVDSNTLEFTENEHSISIYHRMEISDIEMECRIWFVCSKSTNRGCKYLIQNSRFRRFCCTEIGNRALAKNAEYLTASILFHICKQQRTNLFTSLHSDALLCWHMRSESNHINIEIGIYFICFFFQMEKISRTNTNASRFHSLFNFIIMGNGEISFSTYTSTRIVHTVREKLLYIHMHWQNTNNSNHLSITTH